MESAREPVVQTKAISKSFSGVEVLSKVDLDVFPGEIHAVVGENGAGKSTLMRIICGVIRPSEGEICVEGRKVIIDSPHRARDLGIALIHQEPVVFADLDVTENIFMGHTRKRNMPFIDWKRMYAEAAELLESLEVRLDPRAKMKGMSVADQQMVEIISAISQNSKFIIMDEPTAALTPSEVDTLFSVVRKLQAQGKAIVFISHRIDEVIAISNQVSVLRDGKKVGTVETAGTTKSDIINMMIGRTMDDYIHKEETAKGDCALSVRGLRSQGVFADISFDVRRGEIVGIAGLVGAGRSEVARAIFGIEPPQSGEIEIQGKKVVIRSPQDAVRNGIAYLPEDRQNEGLFLPFSIANNISYSTPGVIARRGWINFGREKDIAVENCKRFDVKMRKVQQMVKELSGGNQQKVVLAKWLLTGPDIFILDEPTRGIDVGAKEEVYRIINQLACNGKAIVMISSELPEIIALSDKVIVMKEGRITGRFEKAEVSEANLMHAATASTALGGVHG